MNTSTIKRFLKALSSAVEIERGQLYQLVQSAEASYYLRDVNSQREIGLLLQSFGYPFNQVGKYYESIFLFRTGQSEKARELLENVAESAPARYRSKALLSISRVEQSVGHFEESLRLRLQIQQPSADPVTLIEAQQGIAILRSVEGDHRGAIRQLEHLMPLAHAIGKQGHPAYISFLNSYALELSEVGRDTEAEQAANIIATSPLINRYWEMRETVSEVLSKRKSRSMVSLALLKKQIEGQRESESVSNVLKFPTGERILEVRAALESNEIRELSLTPLQLLGLILRMMLEERVTDEEIEKICVLYYDTVTKWYPPDWPSGI